MGGWKGAGPAARKQPGRRWQEQPGEAEGRPRGGPGPAGVLGHDLQVLDQRAEAVGGGSVRQPFRRRLAAADFSLGATGSRVRHDSDSSGSENSIPL